LSLAGAVQRFINNPKDKNANTHIDSVEWPKNTGCSADKSSFSLRKQSIQIIQKLMAL